MIGFGCELLSMTEICEDARLNINKQDSLFSCSDISLDSNRIRGDDIEEDDDMKTNSSPVKSRGMSTRTDDTSLSRNSSVKVQIKTAEIHLGEIDMNAPHIQESYASLEKTVAEMPGVLNCIVQQKKRQQTIVASLSYKANGTPLRDIITKI